MRSHERGTIRSGASLAAETGGSAGEESRLSSDSSDKPFVFNKPIPRSCHWFIASRPGRVGPLKAGCSQDWLPHKAGRFANLPHKARVRHDSIRVRIYETVY
jgi:hypothetical protein